MKMTTTNAAANVEEIRNRHGVGQGWLMVQDLKDLVAVAPHHPCLIRCNLGRHVVEAQDVNAKMAEVAKNSQDWVRDVSMMPEGTGLVPNPAPSNLTAPERQELVDLMGMMYWTTGQAQRVRDLKAKANR
jgi:hypothetical protein